MKHSKSMGLGALALAAVIVAGCGGETINPGPLTCDPACTDGKVCKDGQCVDETPVTGDCDPACGENETCNKETKKCEPNGEQPQECQAGQETCGTVCANLQTDPNHCGQCDNACSNGQICDNGACKWDCTNGQTACEDGCYDLQNDVVNCGECGKKCNTADDSSVLYTCNEGKCALDCGSQTACGDSCVDLQSDNANCGSCGNACSAENGELCTNGQCIASCPAGEDKCGNECFDLDSNKDHCGSCDNKCTGSDICINGVCGAKCQTGETECADGCFDLTKDKNHCGACDKACDGDLVCGNGECVQGCPDAGQVACDGSCIDPSSDSAWCGASGTCTDDKMGLICSSNASCNNGVCVCPSDAPTLCQISERETVCVDPQTSDQYCGCGEGRINAYVDCTTLPGTAESHCVSGVCESTCDTTHASCDNDPATGCETDISTIEHCGACDNACSTENATETACVLGVCKPTCKPGYVDCGGKCISLDDDKANCGYCGNVCGEGQECNDGFCQVEECGDDGYVFYKLKVRDVDGKYFDQTVKAYCLDDTKFLAFRNSINNGSVYPSAAANTDKAYILMADVNISEKPYKPIGNRSKPFQGFFIGNGHLINASLETVGDNTGLFGYVKDSVIDGFNLAVDVTGSLDTKTQDHFENTGALVGYVENSIISRNKVDGKITGDQAAGGLIGYAKSSDITMNQAVVTVGAMRRYCGGILGKGENVKIENATAKAKVGINVLKIYEKNSDGVYAYVKDDYHYKQENGYWHDFCYGGLVGRLDNSTLTDGHSSGSLEVFTARDSLHGNGGLVGWIAGSEISNSSSTSEIKSGFAFTGGLVGYAEKTNITNSFATGNVKGERYSGGLVGRFNNGKVDNCFASGNITGEHHQIGGFMGQVSNATITNCNATGNVGTNHIYCGEGAGFIGQLSSSTLTNVSATGNVVSSLRAGGLVGTASNSTIENASATGSVQAKGDRCSSNDGVTGEKFGGLIGNLSGSSKVKNCLATGDVTATIRVGGLIGASDGSTIENSYAMGTSRGSQVGGLIGSATNKSTITNCAAIGDAKGEDAGGIIGYVNPGVHSLRNTYGSSAVSGARNIGALLGNIDTSSRNSISLKNTYYWAYSSANSKIYGLNEDEITSVVTPFVYNDDHEAVLSDDSQKLADALGSEWTPITCELKSGPGSTTAGEYTFPVLKSLGTEICK